MIIKDKREYIWGIFGYPIHFVSYTNFHDWKNIPLNVSFWKLGRSSSINGPFNKIGKNVIDDKIGMFHD